MLKNLKSAKLKMKKLIALAVLFAVLAVNASEAMAAIKYVNSYSRSNGTYVSGHYRDTSGDGNPFNNANYLGYND